jgi:hypothetical protein
VAAERRIADYCTGCVMDVRRHPPTTRVTSSPSGVTTRTVPV